MPESPRGTIALKGGGLLTRLAAMPTWVRFPSPAFYLYIYTDPDKGKTIYMYINLIYIVI